MSQTYTINQNGHKTLERPVAEIEVLVGSIVVADAEGQAIAEEGDKVVPVPGFVNLVSLTGANITVTYADEVETVSHESEHGDTGGGETGGYESRTKAQLSKLATDRKIAGRSDMDKDELIAALRDE